MKKIARNCEEAGFTPSRVVKIVVQVDRGEPQVVGVERGQGLERGQQDVQDHHDASTTAPTTTPRRWDAPRDVLGGPHFGEP